jgi:VanZ family protein
MSEGRRTALLGILVVALPALALVAKMPAHPQILAVLNNAAHAPVFGALAVVLLLLLRQVMALREWQRYAAALVLAVAIGGLIELIQPAFGRGAEWIDLRNDALGAVAGLALAASLAAPRRWTLLIGAVALAPVLWPVLEASIAYASRAREFPTLLGDDSRADRYFIRALGIELVTTALPPPWKRANDPRSLRILIAGGSWPGITHSEPQPDWRGYSRLLLDLTNPGSSPLMLTVRVHDREHDNRSSDRFNRRIELAAAQRRTIVIPLADVEQAPDGRQLDLARIAGLIVFADADPALIGRQFYVTRVWLE